MFLRGERFPSGRFPRRLAAPSLAPKGDGHPVWYFPDLLQSDSSTRPLRQLPAEPWLSVSGWRQGRNLVCAGVVQHAMVDLVTN